MSKEKVQSSAFRWLDIPNNDIEQHSYMCFPKCKGPAETVTTSMTHPCPLLGRTSGHSWVAKAVAGRDEIGGRNLSISQTQGLRCPGQGLYHITHVLPYFCQGRIRWFGVQTVSKNHLEALLCLFCDPAIKMMCTDCPDFRPGSSAPCGLSLPAEWS